jgi:hypothetical protein
MVMADLGDVGAAQMALAAGATVGVSTFLFLMLQAIKDWFPSLEGRHALAVLYGLSVVIGVALIAQTTPDWWDYTTYLSMAVLIVSVSIVAKGVFAQLFHVKAEGIPPSSDAVATTVVDPSGTDGETTVTQTTGRRRKAPSVLTAKKPEASNG